MLVANLSRAALALVAGLATGLASAHWAMSLRPERTAKGGTTWRMTGAGEARIGPYALAASLAEFRLPPPQSLEFIATRDSEGRTLYGDCVYRLYLPPAKARWWTLQLMPPGERSLSASHAMIAEASGTVEISIARDARPGNWIAPGEAAPFRAILTLAAPPREQAGEPAALGDIERVACK
jgi:hypothetical protein